ncbi:vWA domain-containing protein [Sciscionella marina]|uniref:vWA domain-containing protein n=1 Tax=Sciscionella marina TaxID=508770 RepID=UPI000379CED6|nr:VWA domain-containing protein [Sciscionella marina]
MEPLPGLLGFTHALAAAGVPADPHRAMAFTEAIGHIDIADPRQLYAAGRATLCGKPDDLPVYARVFAAWFGAGYPGTTPATEKPARPRIAALDRRTASGEPGESLRVAADDTEILRHRDLAELTEAERERVRALLAELDVRPPLRSSMRRRPAHRGELDPGRTLRGMLASGGEPVHLRHRASTPRPRRIVLLLDISGSMRPYADALLRFAHVVTKRAATETFTIGTRLTRLTPALRARDPELALAAAARTVPDWAGGTRIGESLRVFCDRWGQRGFARGAVVVVYSDGWERGETDRLGEQMARLHRLAHKVFWVNPHAGRAGYEPVQSGIAAALGHIDRLLAGHSLETLRMLLREVRDA